MRPSRPAVRLARRLLAYTLLASLLIPTPWRSASSPTAASAAGRAVWPAAQGGGRSDAAGRAGELLVRFGADVTERGRDDIASSKGARRGAKLRGDSGVERLEVEPDQDATAAAERLRRQAGVEFAEPNYLVRHEQVTPTDARFPEQWAPRNAGQTGGMAGADVRASGAWRETVGLHSTVVAVVDGGVDFTHPDLAANRWVNRGRCRTTGRTTTATAIRTT